VVAAATRHGYPAGYNGFAAADQLLPRGVSAVQRGHLKYDGDVTSLECLR
jgi:hypothetical protein